MKKLKNGETLYIALYSEPATQVPKLVAYGTPEDANPSVDNS